MDSEIKEYFSNVSKWREELLELRTIILSCHLEERYKWRVPCYTIQNKNIVAINSLKDVAAISFFKGVLLRDTEQLLLKPGENSQSGRWMKFNSFDEIVTKKEIIHAYILEAIEIEKSGKKIAFKKTSDYEIPEELEIAFGNSEAFHIAFEALTPSRQRGYLLHFAGAK